LAVQFLTLTYGVDNKATRIDDDVKGMDGKVKDIGDTVRVVNDGARCVIFSYYSFFRKCLCGIAARWKRINGNRSANGKRSDSNKENNAIEVKSSWSHSLNPSYP
jgi:hypothetical protein